MLYFLAIDTLLGSQSILFIDKLLLIEIAPFHFIRAAGKSFKDLDNNILSLMLLFFWTATPYQFYFCKTSHITKAHYQHLRYKANKQTKNSVRSK